jgi:hypothetical protein
MCHVNNNSGREGGRLAAPNVLLAWQDVGIYYSRLRTRFQSCELKAMLGKAVATDRTRGSVERELAGRTQF